ncbi:class II fumarate hydratase [Legionella sp. D16C41]|uniref:class II fumarate hydratase n=1 Tax=Legionella sp. D16C41 TaxID=3402688 RepID=UPI003AF99AF4
MSSEVNRIEHDGFGEVKVPQSAYWGSSTQRASEIFQVSCEKFPHELIHMLGIQKKAAALSNIELGFIDKKITKAMLMAIDELISGQYDDQFPLTIWQTGSGTQTNMNANEIIANRANEILGHEKGTKSPVHPNNHVNLGQSSNDTFPTVMRIVAYHAVIASLIPALQSLKASLTVKATQFQGIVKIARTHLMDAVPVNLTMNFEVYTKQCEHNIDRLKDSLKRVRELPQGGTAAGSGLNMHPHFPEKFIKNLNELTGYTFSSLKVKNEGMSAHDALVELSGTLNVIATSMMKIANDIRWGASGPRCGINEILLPIDGLTSSSMPGKVNPTQSEMMIQICAQVMGNHQTITIAGSNGNFEFCNWNPVIIYNLLQSIRILEDGINSFNKNCIAKIDVNRDVIKEKLAKSLSLVTALNFHIGYDKASEVAVKALKENITIKEAALQLNYLTAEQFDKLVDPIKMANPF